MITTESILKAKYGPPQAEVEDSWSQQPLSKSATTIIQDGKTYTVLMNANDYDTAVIAKAAREFSDLQPQHRSNSFLLPGRWNDSPAGSWMLVWSG